MENADFFKENNYCIVDNVLSPEMCKIVADYTLFDEAGSFHPEGDERQVPGSHYSYSDYLMESLLMNIHPIMEENTGLKLGPTYSYYRVYRDGHELKEHIDRPSCEISATLCLGYNYDDSGGGYPIKIGDQEFSQEPGDMIIYRGTEVPHSRGVFNGSDEDTYHSQVFLHYVDMNGPNAQWLYDKRVFLGVKKSD